MIIKHPFVKYRKPDEIIGEQAYPYMYRWYIIKSKWFSVYVHRFWRSDDARALHDHQAFNISILLKGWYLEKFADTTIVRSRGSVCIRGAREPHRIIVADTEVRKGIWSIWIKGPETRDWGFHCPQGWIQWQQYGNNNGC